MRCYEHLNILSKDESLKEKKNEKKDERKDKMDNFLRKRLLKTMIIIK